MKSRIRKNSFKNRKNVSKSQIRMKQRNSQSNVVNSLKSKMLDDILD